MDKTGDLGVDVIDAMARAIYEHQPYYAGVDRVPKWETLPQSARGAYAGLAESALRAAEQAGWRLVPVEPTQEMLTSRPMTIPTISRAYMCWRVMLEAAPRPWDNKEQSGE